MSAQPTPFPERLSLRQRARLIEIAAEHPELRSYVVELLDEDRNAEPMTAVKITVGPMTPIDPALFDDLTPWLAECEAAEAYFSEVIKIVDPAQVLIGIDLARPGGDETAAFGPSGAIMRMLLHEGHPDAVLDAQGRWMESNAAFRRRIGGDA